MPDLPNEHASRPRKWSVFLGILGIKPAPAPRIEPREPRQGGAWKGLARISDEFDAPLPPEVSEGFGIDQR